MTVTVLWMDDREQVYEHVESVRVGSDQVLRLYGTPVVGKTPILAELPIFHIRQIVRAE